MRNQGCFTYEIPAHLITSGPDYLIGFKHGKESRPMARRDSPVYCNGWAAGYAETRKYLFDEDDRTLRGHKEAS